LDALSQVGTLLRNYVYGCLKHFFLYYSVIVHGRPTILTMCFYHCTLYFYVTVPPEAPSYSCALAEGSGSTTRVTLTWTEPPGGDNIDQYCITSSPEYPSAHSVCVTPDVQTHQYEVQQGLEYNLTILAVNCGNQNGTETPPISVFPQGICVCMYVCMYVHVCMCVCMYVCMYMYVCVCMYVCA